MKDNIIDDKQGTTSLRTLERGLDILDCFCHSNTKLSLSELAATTGLNPSTAFRILATLEKRNYINRNPETKKYQLGSQFYCLFSPSLDSLDLRTIAAPHLQHLFSLSNESVCLYVVLDNHRVCLDRIETTHPLRRVIHVGDRLSLTKGAGGKVLLAWMTENQRQKYGITDSSLSPNELDIIKQKGFSSSLAEREEGVAAIAAPIFNANEEIIAALSMSGPTVRFTQEVIGKMIPLVIKTANDISLDLGYKNKFTPQ
ncbi:IclR family transcriptional regulator [Pelosinus propionicus]|uniref:DNA-binding transcriptional regulator, IclR family n=1 Tax=Pelosinus propionicus DSM 13327 TaxID=1123291 RepID=A0A1I4NC39_9FIRM|nr:IclR family transcriptional regulator [Pelosinus propionicus]SFM12955.1 DNA-binding transcriptional regulator, IclR family [Pelosinus propionicus DSM 13327]